MSDGDRITYTPVLDKKPSIWMIPQATFIVGGVSGVSLLVLYMMLATIHLAPALVDSDCVMGVDLLRVLGAVRRYPLEGPRAAP